MKGFFMALYLTVKDAALAEYTINKSRFIANVQRVKSESEAVAYLNSIQKKYWDANHNCSAYIIGRDTACKKANDDGEPSGTAGRPILNVLERNNLTDLIIIITRYFGGIKLGAGGLIRAYGHSASLALEKATIVELVSFQKISLSFPYSDMGSIENYLHKNNIVIVDKSYTDIITFTILLPVAAANKIIQELIDITANRCKTHTLEQIYRDVPIKKIKK